MIAVDTSSLRRFLAGSQGTDVDTVANALENGTMVLPPLVLTEILSDAGAAERIVAAISAVPLLDLLDGYWVRAGMLRGSIIAGGRKCKIADALIAQSCIDHQVPLITFDRDFRHFARFGLVLA